MYDVCIWADAKSTSTGTGRTGWAVSVPIESAGIDGSGPWLGVSNHHVRCFHPGGCRTMFASGHMQNCIREDVIASSIPGRTGWAVSAPIESAGIDGSGPRLGVSNHYVHAMFASWQMQNLHPLARHRVNHLRSNRLGCVGSDAVGWCRRLLSTARCQQSSCTYDVCIPADAKICIRKNVIASITPYRTGWAVLCRLRSSGLASTARVHGSVSAIILCIRCLHPNGCRNLHPNGCRNLHPQERHRVNPSRSY
jgi:hypothetical protein